MTNEPFERYTTGIKITDGESQLFVVTELEPGGRKFSFQTSSRGASIWVTLDHDDGKALSEFMRTFYGPIKPSP